MTAEVTEATCINDMRGATSYVRLLQGRFHAFERSQKVWSSLLLSHSPDYETGCLRLRSEHRNESQGQVGQVALPSLTFGLASRILLVSHSS